MLESQLAVQLYTIRDFLKTEKELAESLAKLRAIGYRAVQLSAVGAMDVPEGGTPLVSAARGRQLLDDNGLRCIATHRSWKDLRENTQAEIDFHSTLGCDYVALGGLWGSYDSQGEAGYRQFLAEAQPVAEKLKAAGIRFGYHNHSHEFVRIGPGRRTLYDILIDEGGELKLEIDVYWAVHAGVNPVRLFERLAGRVPVMHLKDKEVVPKEGPIMAAIGEGNIDWDGILPACDAAGVEWYAVEQDTCPRDPFDCLRSSYEFLVAYANKTAK